MPKKKNYKKIIGFWVLVFLVGGFSGVFLGRFFVPWLTGFSPFNKVDWLCNVKDNTTIINKTEKIYISQETAYQDAIGKIGSAVVAVRVERAGRLPIENSGFILTSDGLIVTADFVVAKDARILVAQEGKEYEAQIVRRDQENQINLIKIDANNLTVADFGESRNLRLGEKVFLIGAAKTGGVFYKFINMGFIKTLLPDFSFSFSELSLVDGAPLGNIEGKVLGLVLAGKQGGISLVAEDRIKELMNK